MKRKLGYLLMDTAALLHKAGYWLYSKGVGLATVYKSQYKGEEK